MCVGGGVVTFSLLYSSVAFTVCVCVCVGGGGGGGGKNIIYKILFFNYFELPMQDSHLSLCSIKYCIICIFLIHSDSLQKILPALFKLVWNTKKSTNFFKYQGKMFLNIENVFVS